ncbi:hypothetical protein [Spirillospora sp. CA-294931]|uniref:hypothetical protein n=1 Tax=Spirillospora sp. CA-294931 TaxID=3240042 RepID=UPI003D8F079F
MRRTFATASALALAALTLTACGEKVVERSFVDQHGRVCAYVMVEEQGGGKDVGNISCEYPPSRTSPTPTATP